MVMKARPRCRDRPTRTSPSGALKDRALSIRLRSTWPSAPSWPETMTGSAASEGVKTTLGSPARAVA